LLIALVVEHLPFARHGEISNGVDGTISKFQGLGSTCDIATTLVVYAGYVEYTVFVSEFTEISL
jgi:hypothetical protein